MIVYMTDHGKYFSIEESLKNNLPMPRGLYINLTNQCNCYCVFCLRQKKSMAESSSLWLKNEPTVEEIKSELDKVDWKNISEVVFCGFGEPTKRLNELLEILKYVKKIHPTIPTRLNTNGLGELQHGRNISSDFENILDTVSISLNSATAEKYFKITRSKFGLKSHEAMLTFAEHIKKFVPNVILTVVDKVTPPEEIIQCKKICEKCGLTLRIRPYEDK